MRFRKLATITLTLCLLAGCKSTAYVQHPGSVNTFDSTSYDAVVTTKAIIDQAKTDLASNVFPTTVAAKVKVALNTGLIPAYNVLDKAYIDYHMAVATDPNASQTAVSAARDQVNAAVSSLNAAKVGQ